MIQKSIYTFWDAEKIPKLCKVCINSWKLHCPEFEITILHLNNFENYIQRPIPNEFKKLSIQKKTNWIRCVLIYENGGIWMDPSILLTQNINKWFNYNYEFVGIRNGKRVENWFFAAPKKSLLVLEWIKEYEYAMSIGAEQYEKDAMKLIDWDKWTYLYHQLCFLSVCQRLSINIFDKNSSFYCLKKVNELGFPNADTKYNFNNWVTEFKYNIVRLGIKSQNIAPLYKMVSFTRKWAEKALQSKIQKESPLYLAGYRNHHKINFKIYYYSIFIICNNYILNRIKYFFTLIKQA